VKVPPVSEWPEGSDEASLYIEFTKFISSSLPRHVLGRVTVTGVGAEAERMEAER